MDIQSHLARVFILFFILLGINVCTTQESYSDPKIESSHSDKNSATVQMFELGKEYYTKEKFDRAKILFQKCVNAEPQNAEYLCWLAQTKGFLLAEEAKQGASNLKLLPQGRKIKQLYDKALKASPNNERARIGTAIILRDIPGLLGGDVERAEEILKSVIKDNPQNIFAYHHLGTLYIRQQEKYQKGMKYLKKVESIVGNRELNKEEKMRISSTYHAIGKTYLEHYNDPTSAITYFKKAQSLEKDSIVTLIDIAEAYRKVSQTDKAKSFIEKAIQIADQHNYIRFESDLATAAQKLNMKQNVNLD